MKLEYLVYSPLMEDVEENVKGWDKDTVNYVVENDVKVRNIISKTIGKSKKTYINNSDIDDIYSEVLLYFYKVDDYNIGKARVTKDDGSDYTITLEDYILKSIEFCLKRFTADKYKRESLIVSNEIRTTEDDILDILDTIADSRTDIDFDDVLVDLNKHCEQCESIRYKYGGDIYLILFVGLLALENKLDNVYFDIMNALGLSKKEIREISKRACKDETLLEFAMGISKSGASEAIDILEQYVFAADKIKSEIRRQGMQEVV